MADLVFRREDSSYNLSRYVTFLTKQVYWDDYKKVKDYRHSFIEDDNNHGVPMMNGIFYSYFKEHRSAPPWKTYMNLYKSQYVKSTADGKFTFNDNDPRHNYTFTEAEIDRKIMNGIMSFYKEGYVIHWLWENGFPNAYYSSKMDKDGFDICIEHSNNHLYGIRVYCHSDRSVRFADIKTEERLVVSSNIVSIKLEVALNDSAIKLGDTYVPPLKAMRGIRNIIQKGGLFDFGIYAKDYAKPKPKKNKTK